MAEIKHIDETNLADLISGIKAKADKTYAKKINQAGSTADRPTTAELGQCYFDTGLNKPIWFNGTNWVDYTGATI